MTIQRLLYQIDYFQKRVVKSGLSKKLEGYIDFLENGAQNNTIILKEITQKFINLILPLFKDDVSIFENLFPDQSEDSSHLDSSFTKSSYLDELEELKSSSINNQEYQSQLIEILKRLNLHINHNAQDLKALKTTLSRFKTEKNDLYPKGINDTNLIISFLHPTKQHSLEYLTNQFIKWNQGIQAYYDLLEPNSIYTSHVQNKQDNSFEYVISLRSSIANNLLTLYKKGLVVFEQYLAWKSQNAHIEITNNEKLLELNEEYENELVNNFQLCLRKELVNQYETINEDERISPLEVNEKTEIITNLVKEIILSQNIIRIHDDKKTLNQDLISLQDNIAHHKKQLNSLYQTIVFNFSQKTEPEPKKKKKKVLLFFTY